MSALRRDELIMACARLYDASQENYMLPPLTRGAAEESETSFTYQCLSEDICLKFSVVFDDDYVQRHKFPLPRLPLQFRTQICDRELKDLPVKLDEKEKSALIYAFLLGVRAPIALEEEAGEAGFTLSIQLSPTFFVRWRESITIEADATADDICRKVGLSLYEKSQDFFLSEGDGVAVWSARAAQELLGASKPSAEELWSRVAPALLSPLAASSAATASGGDPRPAASARHDERLPPVPVAFRASQPSRSGRGHGVRHMLVAALLLVGTIGGLHASSALRGAGYTAPQSLARDEVREAALAPHDASPAPEVVTPQAPTDPEPGLPQTVQTPPEADAPAASIAALEAPPASASSAILPTLDVSLPAKSAKAKCKAPKQAIAVKAGSQPLAKSAARLPAREKSPHRAAKKTDNPLAMIGRAIHGFATNVAKGFQSAPPHRSSSL